MPGIGGACLFRRLQNRLKSARRSLSSLRESHHETAIVTVLLALAVSGCGGGHGEKAAKATPPVTPSSTPTPTLEKPEPSLLTKDALAQALVGLSDMPPGFTKDPEATEGNKYFCDYRPPFKEKFRATGSFSNDADGQYVTPVLRQFDYSDQATASFAALVKVIGTCKTEKVDGSTLNYSEMSVPQLGDDAVGVQIKVDDYTLMQNFVLSGPTIVSTGGVGVTATKISDILKRQVEKYAAAVVLVGARHLAGLAAQ